MEENEIKIKFEPILIFRGESILDSNGADILKAIEREESMISVSKKLGIPYSRVWELIVRIERVTGKKVVITQKGGKRGGKTKLTDFGKKLVSMYESALAYINKNIGPLSQYISISINSQLTMARSSDYIMDIVVNNAIKKGCKIDDLIIGSGLSLAMLALEKADIACMHLYDPITDDYNKSFIERFWLKDRVEKIISFKRELVFAYRRDLPHMELKDIIHKLLNGELKLINRNRGSGTRDLLDLLLKEEAKYLNKEVEKVVGYESEYQTDDEIIKMISSGKGDIGLTLRYLAEKHNLKYTHVKWETYECFSLKNIANKEEVSKLKDIYENTVKSYKDNIIGYIFE
ncbi:substrate-binding domain-containing protein [Fervidicoccus fontis]|uniref:PBP domain-containing protein n=1 Tax=Fervidicoccus fontis TaxID=683846 RepID=A0A7C2VEQ7_9CREN|nr:substrate-binding domain-containing protein [Fervidicoccus fontis]HEW63807.1 hypothetical protein [Fervidicoccus fontis]